MFHVRSVIRRIRVRYHRDRVFVVRTLRRARHRYRNVKRLGIAHRNALRRKRKRKLRFVSDWNTAKKKAFKQAVNRARGDFDTRFPAPHLNTFNDPPDDKEIETIRDALERAEAETKVYYDKMKLKSHWEPAGKPTTTAPPRITRLEAHITQLKGKISALRRLPPELLQAIFIWGLFPQNQRPESYHLPQIAAYPWSISQVCRLWRQIALSTAEIWTYLPPFLFKQFQLSCELRAQYETFKLMIERSKNLGLHVVVSTQYLTGKIPPSNPSIDLLIEQSERWESIAMPDINTSQLTLFNNIKGRLPRLKRLAITSWFLADDNGALDRDMFIIAPQLVDVSWYPHGPDLNFTLGHLMHLSIYSTMAAERMQEALYSNANTLRTLCLSNGPLLAFPGMLMLPNLTKFILSSRSRLDPTHGLNHFVLPALEEFYISAHDTTLTEILALLQRSHQATISIFPLKRLYIGYDDTIEPFGASPETIEAIFVLAPFLRSLECPLPPLTILRRLLSENKPERALLPMLEYCKFYVPSYTSMSWASARLVNKIGLARCHNSGDEALADGSLDVSYVKRLRCLLIGKTPNYEATPPDGSNLILSRSQNALNDSWIAAQASLDPKADDLLYSGDEANDQATSSHGTEMMMTLRRLMEAVFPCSRKYDSNPVSKNPFSKYYISRKDASALFSHLVKCKNDPEVKVRHIAASRISGSDLTSLQDCLKCTGAVTKKANPYLQKLQEELKDLIESWLFAIDEHMDTIHWVYDDNMRTLVYIHPLHPLRSMSDASSGMVFGVDSTLCFSDCLKEFREIAEEMALSLPDMTHRLG